MKTEKSIIDEVISDLNSRNKELECLFNVDEILTNYEISLEEITNQLIHNIPIGFRQSNICVIRIEIDGVINQSSDFLMTDLKLIENINSEFAKIGQLTLVYSKPIHEEKGIFLASERQLLKTIATKIGSHIYYRKLRNTIAKLQNDNSENSHFTTDENIWKWLQGMNLTDEEINKILKVKIDFTKGETIIKQGAFASYVILLTEGLSKNYLEGNNERGFIFKIIKPINFIGLSALFGDNNFSFSGSALTNCTAYLIDSQLMKNIIAENHNFSKKIFNWYCEMTKGHLNKMSSLANKQSLGRFAETLIYLSRDVFEGPIITINVSRKDIAELAAISTESGVRFLSDLKKDEIISVTPSNIEILKPEVLRLIAG